GAGGETVDALFADEAEEVPMRGDLVGGGDVPGGEIAAADVENLAFADELFHGLPDFVPWRRAFDVMHLVKVDAVGLQSAQAAFTGLLDMTGGKTAIVRAVTHVAEAFRGEDNLLASATALFEPASDDLFGEAFAFLPAVHVGGIE